MNSRGRQPTVSGQNTFDPEGVEQICERLTVGSHPRLFTFGRFAALVLTLCLYASVLNSDIIPPSGVCGATRPTCVA